MGVDSRLLEILRCPVTRQPLAPAPRDEVERLNELVRQGGLRYADGSPVEAPLGEALVTEDGALVYRVDDDIPVMLEERAIRRDPPAPA